MKTYAITQSQLDQMWTLALDVQGRIAIPMADLIRAVLLQEVPEHQETAPAAPEEQDEP